jgi:hypothetical protein
MVKVTINTNGQNNGQENGQDNGRINSTGAMASEGGAGGGGRVPCAEPQVMVKEMVRNNTTIERRLNQWLRLWSKR